MKLLIFILSLTSLNSFVFKNATEFIEDLRNKSKANETILKNGLNNTIEFLKHYIYYKISSDPPQPNFDKSYFPKKDILNMFNNIKTHDTNYFDFKNEFFSAIYGLNDLHTSPYLGWLPLDNYIYICPIELIAEYNNETNKTKMYGKFSLPLESYFLFKNSQQVIKAIQNNLKNAIKSINDKDPFDFIQEFAGLKIRNKHSTYVFNQGIYTKKSLNIPVTLKELANFKVIYENGDNFITDYLIVDVTKNSTNLKFYENEEVNQKFISYLINNNKKFNSLNSKEDSEQIFSTLPLKNLDDIISEFEDIYNIQSKNINNFLKTKSSNQIEWKYTYRNKEDNTTVFQCRVDEINKVNVMKIPSFGGTKDSDASLDVAEQCAYLFDENDYRIIIIVPQNGGGNPIVGYNIIELISPYILTRNINRIKKDENMDIFIELYNSHNLFEELNTTNKLKPDYLKDGFVTEKYGNITEELSKPFAWRVNQKRIEEIKSKLKHKRKPNKIAIMTDGFAFSSASSFMKNAYKSGAAIIIGYNGNPNLPENVYDISQSPSAVFGKKRYETIYPDIYKNIEKYKIGLNTITCIASYHEFQESHIPQEYDVQFPDKRIKIYKAYDDIYYQEFIDEAIKVLNSFENNCNPNHEMLTLLSEECNFDNHLHGGYACGNDSKWNKNKCIPVYCDVGYYYNKISNSCIVYPMEQKSKDDDNKDDDNKDNDNNDEENRTLYIILICVEVLILLILIVALILVISYRTNILCFKEKGNTLDSVNKINDDKLLDFDS